jgi:hypothetical protein
VGPPHVLRGGLLPVLARLPEPQVRALFDAFRLEIHLYVVDDLDELIALSVSFTRRIGRAWRITSTTFGGGQVSTVRIQAERG